MRRWLVLVLLACIAGRTWADARAGSDMPLLEQYRTMQSALAGSAFGRPLVVHSQETSESVSGEVYARLNYPHATVAEVIALPENWCAILLLQINIKSCRSTGEGAASQLHVGMGRATEQSVGETFAVVLTFQSLPRSAVQPVVLMSAQKGPFGTHDYRIRVEVIPIESGASFLHLSYSYGYGLLGRVAMRTYLATIGRNKVGFTPTGNQDGNRPAYVTGMRGVVERNVMRYFLAIDAYLSAVEETRDMIRLERRLHYWYEASERYPRQLHEVDEAAYLSMKRKEFRRHQEE